MLQDSLYLFGEKSFKMSYSSCHAGILILNRQAARSAKNGCKEKKLAAWRHDGFLGRASELTQRKDMTSVHDGENDADYNKVDHNIYYQANLMIPGHLSESTEMYLKAMVELSGRDPVMVSRLAERLSVTPVSANEMGPTLGGAGLGHAYAVQGSFADEEGTRSGGERPAPTKAVGSLPARPFEDRMGADL
ncbi:MAG: hypothetical protein HND47_13295 [Chloroflexi bacterium]|nr:hypothetical protein [Chloroflexota bacterium]